MRKLLTKRDDLFSRRLPQLREYLENERQRKLEIHTRWVDGIPVLYPSMAGECLRQSTYDILEPEKAEPEDVESALRLHDGELHEATTVHWLRKMGYAVEDRGKRIRRVFKRGGKPFFRLHARLDGTIWVPGEKDSKSYYHAVLECKGLSTWTMRRAAEEEIIRPAYRTQALIYMRLTGLRHCVFPIKDKNNSSLSFFEQHWSDEMWRRTKKRLVEVAEACHAQKLLPRGYDSPPTGKGFHPCNWCRHSKRCWA